MPISILKFIYSIKFAFAFYLDSPKWTVQRLLLFDFFSPSSSMILKKERKKARNLTILWKYINLEFQDNVTSNNMTTN